MRLIQYLSESVFTDIPFVISQNVLFRRPTIITQQWRGVVIPEAEEL